MQALKVIYLHNQTVDMQQAHSELAHEHTALNKREEVIFKFIHISSPMHKIPTRPQTVYISCEVGSTKLITTNIILLQTMYCKIVQQGQVLQNPLHTFLCLQKIHVMDICKYCTLVQNAGQWQTNLT